MLLTLAIIGIVVLVVGFIALAIWCPDALFFITELIGLLAASDD